MHTFTLVTFTFSTHSGSSSVSASGPPEEKNTFIWLISLSTSNINTTEPASIGTFPCVVFTVILPQGAVIVRQIPSLVESI